MAEIDADAGVYQSDAPERKGSLGTAIDVKAVTKRFRNTLALDQIDVSVPKGKVFALLGENGAGKTTLIRILTGYLRPDSGIARVLDHDCVAQSESIRRRIGYVSDSPAMYEWMSASEIGWFTSAFYDDAFPRRYSELINEFEVPVGTKLSALSKGQRAKVALALAIAHDPELLILDEPTSGLDPMVRRQFLESMVDRAAAGRTVLLSSHQINEVERVADVVAILHAGKLRLVQPLDTLKHHTRIVTATLDDAHVYCKPPRGDVLSETISGRQRRWVINGLPDDWRYDFGDEGGVRSVDEVVPSLEEIFIAVCASKPHETDRAVSFIRDHQLGATR
ncbi:ABC transporter ATP-binding protein [Rhodopirellula sp. SWK7]|uniref:ABC transporter ATP-binding protein n=1 Tax=Rhodopirellula sp. SWK7 TaxID=595460 RepID=UPI0002BE4E61|nr:ABC transporter ATP-binding protein [Rhodopirellula sp. SWK7]EMI45216.1 ABC transporter ATP-binding protein [Rhodopirellula sp. SWK7]